MILENQFIFFSTILRFYDCSRFRKIFLKISRPHFNENQLNITTALRYIAQTEQPILAWIWFESNNSVG